MIMAISCVVKSIQPYFQVCMHIYFPKIPLYIPRKEGINGSGVQKSRFDCWQRDDLDNAITDNLYCKQYACCVLVLENILCHSLHTYLYIYSTKAQTHTYIQYHSPHIDTVPIVANCPKSSGTVTDISSGNMSLTDW